MERPVERGVESARRSENAPDLRRQVWRYRFHLQRLREGTGSIQMTQEWRHDITHFCVGLG